MSQKDLEKVWKLGHVYDLTDYFDKLVKEKKIVGVGDNCYKYGYFVCRDVWDIHIYRIQVGINSEYDFEPRTKIVETENIRYGDLFDFYINKHEIYKFMFDLDEREMLDTILKLSGLENTLKTIIEYDYDKGFENREVEEYRYDVPLDALIEYIDGGYGITKINMI